MTITADTVFYVVLILFVIIVTHFLAYTEGWRRGRTELRKEMRTFISNDEINKAVNEILKEQKE